MNRALIYLWLALLKRRALHLLRGLRRPTSLIGLAALAFSFATLFHYRHREFFAQLAGPEALAGAALIMLGGSLFKGFLQRGLVFEPPDVQFLFTSPFSQRQIVFYRLLPGYLYAIAQSIVVLILFVSHLRNSVLFSICLTLFQITCFHVAAGAAIFGGKISDAAYHRARCMLLGLYLFITALYLKFVLGLKLVPAFAESSLTQIFFYPALTAANFATSPPMRELALAFVQRNSSAVQTLWQSVFYLGLTGVTATASLSILLRTRTNIFETSLATTMRTAEKRLRVQQGRSVVEIQSLAQRSVALPTTRLFCGVGALIWKNLMVAFRSRRELWLAFTFTAIWTLLLIAFRWLLYRDMSRGGQLTDREVMEFDNIIAGLLCVQVFLLQRALSFDFRRDGNHLVQFRTLPVSPLALAIAELAVPTILSLTFQTASILALIFFAHFDWRTALLLVLMLPAIVLALNGVWNLHYLLAATKRTGKAGSTSPVALLMVVVLSFLIFYPAGWTAVYVGRHTFGQFSNTLAMSSGLVVQYGIDFFLVVLLAKLFQRFDSARDLS